MAQRLKGGLCGTEGCLRQIHAKGLCRKHYVKAIYTSRKQEGTHPCTYCTNVAVTRGMCVTHYKRWRQGKIVDAPVRKHMERLPTCRVEGCNIKPHARNYCQKHYVQFCLSKEKIKIMRKIYQKRNYERKKLALIS